MIATPLFASFVSGLLGFAMFIVSLFLILLILVQRGRGGGLTGALGGPGGQSAFGTKAGDLFTRITSFVALGWITLCAFTMWLLGPDSASRAVSTAPTVSASPAESSTATKDLIDLNGPANAPAATSTDSAPKSGSELTPKPTEPAVNQPPAAESPAATAPAVPAPPTQTPAETQTETAPSADAVANPQAE